MASTLQQYIGYNNKVTIGNVAADSSQSAFPVTNLANPATNSRWKSDSISGQYITVSLAGQNVNYVGIAGHNLGASGCAIVIEGQESSGGSWSVIVASFTPSLDIPILKIFTKDEYYAVRVKLTPSGTTKPQIAVLYIGEVMLLERNAYVGKTPMMYARNVSSVNGFAESGDFLGRIIRGTTYSAKISIANMSPAWYRSTFDAFVQASATTPFFYAWRYVDYPLEIGYAVVSGGVPIPQNTGPNKLMSISFDIEGRA